LRGFGAPRLTRLRSQHQSQGAVTGLFSNRDSLEKANRGIVTLFEVAEVVPVTKTFNPREPFVVFVSSWPGF